MLTKHYGYVVEEWKPEIRGGPHLYIEHNGHKLVGKCHTEHSDHNGHRHFWIKCTDASDTT